MRLSGAENPSQEEVESFKKLLRRHRIHATILELFFALWMDGRTDHVGTKAYLKFQGMNDASPEDLAYFHTRIVHTAIWRTAVLAIVTVGWSAFAWSVGMWWTLSNFVILLAILVCGVSVTSGTKLIAVGRGCHGHLKAIAHLRGSANKRNEPREFD